jgi:hypothetical protein
MTDTTMPREPSGLVTGARWALLALAALFTLGAFTQFFLVGISYFDNPVRWKDHANLGHILGLLPYVMWIPAVLGRAGTRVILGALLLFVLFMAQYAFIEIDNSMAHAFHPLNGSILLVLGFWLTQRAFALTRGEDTRSRIEGIAR